MVELSILLFAAKLFKSSEDVGADKLNQQHSPGGRENFGDTDNVVHGLT
jgi:hypothetical protein